MGTTHSSLGLTMGSALGGLLIAPFTGGASLVLVAAAAGTGTVVGTGAFVVNAVSNRDSPEDERLRDFAIGAGCGAIGPLTAGAASFGADIAYSFEIGGIAAGVVFSHGPGSKPLGFVGNREVAIEEVRTRSKATFPQLAVSYAKDCMLLKNAKAGDSSRLYTFETCSLVNKSFYDETCLFSKDMDTTLFLSTQTHARNDDPFVDRFYVIRRKLDTLPVFLGWMAHSGLLLKTRDGRWFVCEYGTEADKNRVSLHEVRLPANGSCSNKFEHEGRTWDKQICGERPKSDVSIQFVKSTMENQVHRHTYSILFWNCHMAQEGTRRSLGLAVDNAYLESLRSHELIFE